MGAGVWAPQPCPMPPVPPAPVPRAGEVLALMELSGTQRWRGTLGEICPPKAAEDFFCELFLASPPLVRAVT